MTLISNTEKGAVSIKPHGFLIPIKPKALTQLQRLMKDSESIIADFAKVIAKDVSLSAAVLKTVNSAFFALETQITDIQHAVCFIGKDIINALATAIMFKQSFVDAPSCLSLERYWDDSKDIAYSMTFINKELQSKLPDGLLYTIGLFHDCGIPAFSNKFNDYKEVLIKANQVGGNSIALEESEYGMNHAVIGYLIARSWSLPEQVSNIILHHHDLNFLTTSTNKEEQLAYATLKLAENLVYRNKRHCESPDWQHIKEEVLATLGINIDKYIELDKYYSDLVL